MKIKNKHWLMGQWAVTWQTRHLMSIRRIWVLKLIVQNVLLCNIVNQPLMEKQVYIWNQCVSEGEVLMGENDVENLYYLIFLILLWMFFPNRKGEPTTSLKDQIRHKKLIDSGKVIIAIELQSLFVHVSNKWHPGYIPIEIPYQSSTLLNFLIEKVLGASYYYRLAFPRQRITDFLDTLMSTGNVQLFVYTYLEPQITDALLNKLQLEDYFNQEHRLCDPKHGKSKHAIQVDKDSRRVIIITPDQHDHEPEDDKYFLVMRPRDEATLKKYLKKLKQFLRNHLNLEDLHEELADLKESFEFKFCKTF